MQKLKVKSECSFLEQLGKKKGNIILPANSFWPHFEQVLNSFGAGMGMNGYAYCNTKLLPFQDGSERVWTILNAYFLGP